MEAAREGDEGAHAAAAGAHLLRGSSGAGACGREAGRRETALEALDGLAARGAHVAAHEDAREAAGVAAAQLEARRRAARDARRR